MMSDPFLAQLFAIAFLHVFPQCAITIEVGDTFLRTGNGQEVSAEILYSTLDADPRLNDLSVMIKETDERKHRDVELERRIMGFRSHRYPRARVIGVVCAKTRR